MDTQMKIFILNDGIEQEVDSYVVYESGNKKYYKNNRLHREDGPAVEYTNGNKEWYINGKWHRENGPAVESDWCKYWYVNGVIHREDGPAIVTDEEKWWYINGLVQREDGPAIERSSGKNEWYYNSKCIGKSVNGFTQEDFERFLTIKKLQQTCTKDEFKDKLTLDELKWFFTRET